MTPPPLTRTNLAEQAYRTIRETLLTGDRFRPGDRISVEDLARRLGVSRSPVWAAITRLEAEGMVEVRPRQGVFFVGFDLGRLRDSFVVREALEGIAAGLAATRAGADDLTALRMSIERQRAFAQVGARDHYAAEAARFQATLTALSGNAVLRETIERLCGQIAAMCLCRPLPSDDIDARIADHAAIVEALARGDGAAADHLARAHVRRLAGALPPSAAPP